MVNAFARSYKKGFQICFRETIWCRVGMQLSATMATELVTARVVAADTATAATKEVIEAAVEGVVAAIAGGVAAEVEDEETEVEAEAGHPSATSILGRHRSGPGQPRV